MSVKQLARGMITTLSFLLAVQANASNATAGTISSFYMFQTGAAFFTTTGTRSSDIPSCASTTPQQWALDSTTAGGKSLLAQLLVAYAAGKSITISGDGTCSAYSGRETINFIYTND